jgi:hypothetical protein
MSDLPDMQPPFFQIGPKLYLYVEGEMTLGEFGRIYFTDWDKSRAREHTRVLQGWYVHGDRG